MVDVNLKVPALEKLLDYTASGIGAVAGPMLAPWKARKEAEAKLIGVKTDADSLKLIADAQAEARRSLAAPDDVGRGVLKIGPEGIAQRIEFQETKRQANIASVVRGAAAELGDNEVPDHEPDHDWTARFFDCVQDVSSDDMRKLWAKILSGEVETPGRTSLRTLETLRNMTRREAQMFRDICDFAISDWIFHPGSRRKHHHLFNCSDALDLDACGLLHAGSFLKYTINFSQSDQFFIFQYQSCLLKILATCGKSRIDIPVILLTVPGKELYRVMKHTFRMDYLQSFSGFLHKENCDLSYTRIIQEHPDGTFTHSLSFVAVEPQPEQRDSTTS